MMAEAEAKEWGRVTSHKSSFCSREDPNEHLAFPKVRPLLCRLSACSALPARVQPQHEPGSCGQAGTMPPLCFPS